MVIKEEIIVLGSIKKEGAISDLKPSPLGSDLPLLKELEEEDPRSIP